MRVVVVDDSAFVRTALTHTLEREPGIEVVATAGDAYEARDRIVELDPHVVTLDLQMPRLDGVSFLRRLMTHHPMPVVVVSAFTSDGSAQAVEALEAGATHAIAKPPADGSREEFESRLVEAVKVAARTSVGVRGVQRWAETGLAARHAPGAIVAIGASIGGPQALAEVVCALPPSAPPVLLVQHMPAEFTRGFAARLDTLGAVRVREAEAGDIPEPGTVLVAPGGTHMVLLERPSGRVIELRRGPAVSSHRPSIDVLFTSVARTAGSDAVGVIMTGMGHDGVAGLAAMRKAGAATLAQDGPTSVVFGMGKLALESGAAAEALPLGRLTSRILELAGARPSGKRDGHAHLGAPAGA
ncbi:MAG: chemotaxis-specific protein-glutamate methyltransferase CheB [Actinobacteria bacterium]|nr:MAG: chemotaxis-specific protein-glutamate methyltransferase CheB [Actinomycetota bacterium]